MAERTIKLPDVGEGVAEAELVEWSVKVGDLVREDMVLAAVMTDKATVEIPAPVDGEVIWLGGEIGDTVAVGAPLIRLKVPDEAGGMDPDRQARDGPKGTPAPEPSPQGDGNEPAGTSSSADPRRQLSSHAPTLGGTAAAEPASASPLRDRGQGTGKTAKGAPRSGYKGATRATGEKPLASPAVRLRAKESGIDLRQVPGSGPAGRIEHEDIDAFLSRGAQIGSAPALARKDTVEEVKVTGLRRRIAEKMALANARIVHITYVEEIDVTAVEELRAALNAGRKPEQPKLTLLPFLMRAMVKAVGEQPEINAIFDDDDGVVHRHGAVHIGIAAQTPAGLMVPVVRHAEARDIWDCAAEVNRLSEAARAGTAGRDELSGSTITITSLGAMGGIVTTPIINHPEVAIVGVNKIVMRPFWNGASFVPRKMMNLSSSFDHRVIDGWDAAIFVQRLKALLETPALIFVDG